jgi:hypothetical protein
MASERIGDPGNEERDDETAKVRSQQRILKVACATAIGLVCLTSASARAQVSSITTSDGATISTTAPRASTVIPDAHPASGSVGTNVTCSNSGTSAATCSGSYSTPYGNDLFSSSSSTGYTFLSESATTDSADSQLVQASASSSASDYITLGGGTGTAYAESTQIYDTQGFNGSASGSFDWVLIAGQTVYTNIVIPVTFNDPYALTVTSQVQARAETSSDDGTYDSMLDLLVVSLFSDAELTNPITSYTYDSQSGALYPFLDRTPTSTLNRPVSS